MRGPDGKDALGSAHDRSCRLCPAGPFWVVTTARHRTAPAGVVIPLRVIDPEHSPVRAGGAACSAAAARRADNQARAPQ